MQDAATRSTYGQRPPERELRDVLAAVWTRRFADGPAAGPILPDGCIDIVAKDERLLVAGPDTAPAAVTAIPGSLVAGVRFLPGAAPAVLGVPASELRDRRVDLGELWGDDARRLTETVFGLETPADRMRTLERAVAARLVDSTPPDRLTAAAARILWRRPGARVASLGRELGLGERQLRRRFEQAVGYGPKTFARVARFRRMLGLLRAPHGDGLAAVAVAAGYADQAHMTRESVRLGGATPGRMRAWSRFGDSS
jgi:AraC-like DNA-binding protein